MEIPEKPHCTAPVARRDSQKLYDKVEECGQFFWAVFSDLAPTRRERRMPIKAWVRLPDGLIGIVVRKSPPLVNFYGGELALQCNNGHDRPIRVSEQVIWVDQP